MLHPFPHLVIDGFLDPAVADRIHDEARATALNVDANNQITQKMKLACTDWDAFGIETTELISWFNSSKFIELLEVISGIEGLFGDRFIPDRGGLRCRQACEVRETQAEGQEE